MQRSLLLISLIAVCNAESLDLTRKTVTQSSTWCDNPTQNKDEYSANKAIDGKTETCSHTKGENSSWWNIDLLGVYDISSVTIYNKNSNNGNIDKAQIHISNSRRDNFTANSKYINITDFKMQQYNNYSVNASGRYITVFSSALKFIVVCEININATKKASPFKLITQDKTWVEALEHCRDKNMELASIINEETQAWAELEAMNAVSAHVWLGLRYTCTLNFWFWISDHVVKFDRWDPERNTTNNCDESAVMRKSDYLWVPTPDGEKHNFICSKDTFQ
ncbi:fucolectin-1-like [Parambassis ranga]|uniref:Fucolectin-1-like n=1 Tax=Parambassis ranga TaxID=210632 RepID=A0A6P7JUE8_9TELE|nr:fucolectin-1-like [Parambassis ranga]